MRYVLHVSRLLHGLVDNLPNPLSDIHKPRVTHHIVYHGVKMPLQIMQFFNVSFITTFTGSGRD